MPVTISIRPIKRYSRDFPHNQFNKYRRKLRRGLRGPVKNHLRIQFRSIVSNWKEKPTISWKFSEGQDSMELYVFPSGPNADIWRFVSLGTRARIIRVRRAKVLSVRLGHSPKTRPGGYYGGSGRYAGPIIHKKSVHHPGIEARRFEKEIASVSEKQVIKLVKRSVRKFL
jgi:hypothetical protein